VLSFALHAGATVKNNMFESFKKELKTSLIDLNLIERKNIIPVKKSNARFSLPRWIRDEYVFSFGPRSILFALEGLAEIYQDYGPIYNSIVEKDRIEWIKHYIHRNPSIYTESYTNDASTKVNNFNQSLKEDNILYAPWPSVLFYSSLLNLFENFRLNSEANARLNQYDCFNDFKEILAAKVYVAKLCDEEKITNFSPPNIKVFDPSQQGYDYKQYDIGKGVFANERIPKGKLIGIYSGLIHTDFSENFHYLMRTPDLLIDGLHIGNYTRYFNHSSLAPNIDLQYIYYQNIVYSMFLSKRSIEKGEELMFDYGYEKIGSIDLLKMSPFSRFLN
jgi:hypothetical protein